MSSRHRGRLGPRELTLLERAVEDGFFDEPEHYTSAMDDADRLIVRVRSNGKEHRVVIDDPWRLYCGAKTSAFNLWDLLVQFVPPTESCSGASCSLTCRGDW